MRDLLTYHGGLSLPGLFMFICEIIFVYALCHVPGPVLQLLWPDIQTQKGNHDCGLFAIANAFALCCGERPEEFAWDQGEMRIHLVHCLNAGKLSMFPVVDERVRCHRGVVGKDSVEVVFL